MSRKVTFSVSTGYVGSRREETYKLEDLGIIESEYETEQELEKAIGEAYEEWYGRIPIQHGILKIK